MTFIKEVCYMKIMSTLNSVKKVSGLAMLGLSMFVVSGVEAQEEGHKCPMKEGKHHVKKFEKMDENKDGSVTKAEFDAMHQAHFIKMDQNKDGAVSLDEMKAFHEAMHAEHHEKVEEKVQQKIEAIKPK
jgi:Ca2+-binding EF-hand superfamily protein